VSEDVFILTRHHFDERRGVCKSTSLRVYKSASLPRVSEDVFILTRHHFDERRGVYKSTSLEVSI